MIASHDSTRHNRSATKPYAMLGAGPLVSTIWKSGCEASGWRYRFNAFRLAKSGSVSQTFSPADLKYFVKLIQLLAATLADDGCVPQNERSELLELAQLLDALTGRLPRRA